MTTYMANSQTITAKWYLVDASGKTLGRLASRLAHCLRGKHKPEYTPHIDTGDYLVVINVDKMVVTGNKAQDKLYHHHSGYPGGIKSVNFATMHSKNPVKVLELAVRGMLPKGPLGRTMLRKLKVCAGKQHPHQAQQPEQFDL